ncbi:MAG: hypothetical protein PHX68_01000 [Alphaproteobacteria bacterium]|nr:hypothetical protein [Alphaproteobacteria bacterium]
MTQKVEMYATTICIQGKAIVIRGASGSGKSSLAMHLMETREAWLAHLGKETHEANRVYLVSDDRTILTRQSTPAGDCVVAAPLPHFNGYMEVRGVGIITDFPCKKDVPVALIVDLRPHEMDLERMPDIRTENVLGVPIRVSEFYADDPFLSSRLRIAFKVATHRLNILASNTLGQRREK